MNTFTQGGARYHSKCKHCDCDSLKKIQLAIKSPDSERCQQTSTQGFKKRFSECHRLQISEN